MTNLYRKLTLALIAGTLFFSMAPRAALAGDDGLGLTVDLGFASAYVFRGWNVFQEKEQMDQNMMLAPSVTWSVFDTGLTIGYWGAFQLNGDNIDGNIDAALGMEQDLFVTYDLALPYDLSASFGLTLYAYPGADDKVMGSSLPMYLEPSAGITWSSIVDVSLTVSYFLGLQDEPGIRDISYLYLTPKVSKSFSFGDMVGLDVGLSYGYKQFKEGNDDASNVHDLDLGISVPIRPLSYLYVAPTVHMAWTNVEDGTDAVTGAVDEMGFGDGLVVWGGVNVGVEF